MRLTAKRGKQPARMQLFDVDKRRIAEVSGIFNIGAMVLDGDQAALCKAASESIAKAEAALEAASAKVPKEMPGQKTLLPEDEETTAPPVEAESNGEDHVQAVRDEVVAIAEATPDDAPASTRRSRK